MKIPSSSLLVAVVLAAACELPAPVEPIELQRQIGVVEWVRSSGPDVATSDPSTVVITAPDTVEAGRPFSTTITTIGPSGCWQAAGAEGGVQSVFLATITPFDRVVGDVCTGALVALPRTFQLRFDIPGQATIMVTGRRVVDGDLDHAETRTVQKQIVVR
jgi:hypothetical protein